MQLALAIGTATATAKHPSMEGQKLLLVQPLGADGKSPDGDPQIVIDQLGTDRGSLVILTSDGKLTRQLLDCDKTPVRWSVMGITDQ